MLFTTFPFLCLLICTWVLYYAKPLRQFQLPIVVIASFVFYGYATPWLCLILLTSCSVNAVSSYCCYYATTLRLARAWSAAGVVCNASLLVAFKYTTFLYHALGSPGSDQLAKAIVSIPLPIGISFFTFQGISLLVDTFRAKARGELFPHIPIRFRDHLMRTTFFKAFFPQLIAGPIVKAHFFLPQIERKYLRDIQWDLVFRYLVTGYFLKMVVADNLKDQTIWIAYPYFCGLSTANLLFLLIGYSIQIFADFAGYSLIAMGLAGLFGYVFPPNFNFPYIARSFSEFWTRWHISLSSWLRDYLYIPLGGNRKGAMRTYLNLFAVMFIGGLWHGAAWSYAIWGMYHGALLAVERALGFAKPDASTARGFGWFRATLVFTCVTFGWLLFKLPNFGDVVRFVEATGRNLTLPFTKGNAVLIAVFSVPVVIYYLVHVRRDHFIRWFGLYGETALYGAMIFMIAVNAGSTGSFIYFQF